MQADLLPFIDWANHPRRVFAEQKCIITAGEPTEMLFLLESGTAKAKGGAIHPVERPEVQYEAGAILSLLEMLALETYLHDVVACTECRVIGISRTVVKSMWDSQNRLAWPLSCSIAASITQQRTIRLVG